MGLALLKMDRQTAHVQMTWTDCLRSHGLAVGVRDRSVFTVMVLPSRVRELIWRRNTTSHALTLTFPACLLMTRMEAGRLRKSSLWLIKNIS